LKKYFNIDYTQGGDMKKVSVIMIISLLMITGLQAQNVQEIDFKSDIHKKVQLTNNYILEKQNSNPDWRIT